MRCVLCGHLFGPDDTGYVRGAISGEVMELLPGGPKPTGQILDHKNIIMCVLHFEELPKYISENLRANAANRKGKA